MMESTSMIFNFHGAKQPIGADKGFKDSIYADLCQPGMPRTLLAFLTGC
jgi:hypothetical protein